MNCKRTEMKTAPTARTLRSAALTVLRHQQCYHLEPLNNDRECQHRGPSQVTACVITGLVVFLGEESPETMLGTPRGLGPGHTDGLSEWRQRPRSGRRRGSEQSRPAAQPQCAPATWSSGSLQLTLSWRVFLTLFIRLAISRLQHLAVCECSSKGLSCSRC